MEPKNLPPLEMDTTGFETKLSTSQRQRFAEERPAFVRLVRQVIQELDLQDHIDHLTVLLPSHDRGRAELFRRKDNPWPSKRLHLEIYADRYMDEQLLRHEFGHEADRRNPDMHYDPAIERRWGDRPVFNLAANISLDARLDERGLGREFRKAEFVQVMGMYLLDVFRRAWESPPRTWPEIEELARELAELRGED